MEILPNQKKQNSRNIEPPRQVVPLAPPQFSPETAAATLQKETNSLLLRKVFLNINSTTNLEESGVVANSDELTAKNIEFSEIQQNWVRKAGNSMEEAPGDGTYLTTLRGNDKIMEIVDWDSDEEDMSDIVIECDESTVRNNNFLKTEENNIAKAVNIIEEPEVADIVTEGAKGDAMEKVNLDLYVVQKSSDAMMMFDKFQNQNPNFDQKDIVSSTEEETKIECMTLTETPGMKELGKSSNADQEWTEKEINSSIPALETKGEECNPIKHQILHEIVGKSARHKELGDQAPESSQVETNYNKTEGKQTKGFEEVIEKMSEWYQRNPQLVEDFMNCVQLIGKAVIEKKDDGSMKTIERPDHSSS